MTEDHHIFTRRGNLCYGVVSGKVQVMQDIKMKLYGQMAVAAYDVKNGILQRIFRYENRNQITDDGRDIVIGLLAQATSVEGGDLFQQNPIYNRIHSLGVGDDPTPPTSADTDLHSQLWISKFNPISSERPASFGAPDFAIEISKTVPPGTLTGSTVTEAGIFTRGAVDDPTLSPLYPVGFRRMYARQVHPGITLTATMSIVYDWRLGVTIYT